MKPIVPHSKLNHCSSQAWGNLGLAISPYSSMISVLGSSTFTTNPNARQQPVTIIHYIYTLFSSVYYAPLNNKQIFKGLWRILKYPKVLLLFLKMYVQNSKSEWETNTCRPSVWYVQLEVIIVLPSATKESSNPSLICPIWLMWKDKMLCISHC